MATPHNVPLDPTDCFEQPPPMYLEKSMYCLDGGEVSLGRLGFMQALQDP